MVLKADQERVKTLLRDTITLLCKNGLEFRDKFSLEALIGVTLDEGEVFLLSINELVKSDSYVEPAALEEVPEGQSSPRQKRKKRVRMQNTEIKKEKVEDDAQQKRPREVSDREDHVESDGADELVFVKEEVGDGPGVWNVTETTVTTSDICYTDGVVASSSSVMQGEGFVAMENLLTSEGIQTTEWADQGNISQQQSSIGSSTVTTTAVTTGQGDGMSGFDQHQQQQQVYYFPRAADKQGKVDVQFDESTKLRKRVCQYDGCDYTTYHRSAMSRHQRKHQKAFNICPFCGKKYIEKYDLSVHITTVHENQSLICKYCGKAFSSRSGLVLHEKKHQNAETEFQFVCQFCGKGYDRIHNFRNHMELHPEYTSNEAMKKELEERVVAKRNSFLLKKDKESKMRFCPEEGCQYSSPYRSSMIRHQKRGHSKTYMKCPKCKRKFVENYDLRRHIETAHEGKSFFPCDKCEKNLSSKKSLVFHRKNECPGSSKEINKDVVVDVINAPHSEQLDQQPRSPQLNSEVNDDHDIKHSLSDIDMPNLDEKATFQSPEENIENLF